MDTNATKNKKEEKNFVGIGAASKISGIGMQTLRTLVDDKKIAGYKTPSGTRRIHLDSLQKMCMAITLDTEKQKIQRKNYIYTRVSSKKQMDDLSRQIEYLSRPEYNQYLLIQDIASGINFKRKGLQTILDSCLQGTIGEVIVAHRDRLSRFGFDLIDLLVTKAGGKITVLGNSETKTCEQELSDDLLSIIHIFSCRQMGRRSYKKDKIQNNSDRVISNRTSEDQSFETNL
jgi:predicted site-specific integrase-resolvase